MSEFAKRAKTKMTTVIPWALTSPDTVITRLGRLKFFDGFPDAATAQKVYDNLDFQRGLQVFLTAMPAASLYAMREGIRCFGPDNRTVIVFETLMDSKSLFLTGNTESVYAMAWLDLKNGPMVVEVPPNILGGVDDFWGHLVCEMGKAGPDQGKGGKYLFLPPDFQGEAPDDCHVFESRTFGNWLDTRGFPVKGDPRPIVDNIKHHLRIYPLSHEETPTTLRFVNVSGKAFNTIHSTDFSFFEELNHVVQEEPSEVIDPDTLGLLAAIGIEKGKRFIPGERMTKILTEAADVGNATVRSIIYRSRLKDAYLYPKSAWMTPFTGGTEFEQNGVRLLDARASFFFYATGMTPAMVEQTMGTGSQYAVAFTDSEGEQLDGSKTYQLHLPAKIPAKQSWSLVVYDNQTRSMLQTDQQFPSIGNQKKGIAINPDTSVDVYFGPEPPEGKESNWVQTLSNKGWNVILRLYGPLQPWFDKSWRPGEIEQISE